MVHAELDFSRLLEQARLGCPEAAQEIYNRYSPHIRRVVRRQLHQRLRSQFDSVDFLQSVWASFFKDSSQRYQFDCPEALVAFLCKVAHNKVVEAFRHRMQTEKHDLNRERSLEQWNGHGIDPPSRLPSPSQVAMAQERWERLLAGQPEKLQRILDLLRQGHTHQETADCLGLNLKAVQRLLQKLNASGDTL